MTNSNTIELATEFGSKVNKLKSEVGKVIVGQDQIVTALVNAIFCHGHVLNGDSSSSFINFLLSSPLVQNNQLGK